MKIANERQLNGIRLLDKENKTIAEMEWNIKDREGEWETKEIPEHHEIIGV